LGVSDI